jgi:penicillin-binding protein 1A
MASSKAGKVNYSKRLWLIGLSPLIFATLLLSIAFLSGLPNIETLANPKINLATEIISSDGKTLGSYYKENRSDVRFDALPPHLVNALIATEDARFREHSGIDFRGLTRAVVKLGSSGGASTITQQLAKLQFTEDYENVSIFRRVWQKIREMIIAARLERTYTKDEIIILYLNQVDFLYQAVGIKSAAHVYFNTVPDSLTVDQSAMLVGMLQNPSRWNPMKKDTTLSLKRREVVLSQMVKYGYLSEEDYEIYRKKPRGIDFQRVSHDAGLAPYFREVLRSKLDEILNEKDESGELIRKKADGTAYNVYSDGLKVYTTIDTRIQQHAEWAVEEHLSKELQAAFFKDISRRKKENYPFYNGIADKDRERIMRQAIEGSERHMILSGKLCPDCKRPKKYISAIRRDGKEYYSCDEDKGGCGEEWEKFDEKGIEKIFNTPVKAKVYAHGAYKDTLISPLDSIKYHKAILHASLMSVEPSTGHIKAWVGGIDFKYFKFDNVYQSRRQVGSTFKPLVYATALRMGKRPEDQVSAEQICIGNWCPKNSGGGYGFYSMRCALANSVNTVSARLMNEYGVDNVVHLAKKMGIKTPLPAVPSLSLGVAELPLFEMVGATSTFANGGVYIEPTFILRIEDKNGSVIYESDPVIDQALDPNVSYQMLSMMKAVVDGSCGSGTGVRLRGGRAYAGIPYPTAGKTGTTQNNTDGWFMGLTPDLVTGVWVGAQDPTVRFNSTALGQGANTGLPIYGYFMKKVYADSNIKISKGDFAKPAGYDDYKRNLNINSAADFDDLMSDDLMVNPSGEIKETEEDLGTDELNQ